MLTHWPLSYVFLALTHWYVSTPSLLIDMQCLDGALFREAHLQELLKSSLVDLGRGWSGFFLGHLCQEKNTSWFQDYRLNGLWETWQSFCRCNINPYCTGTELIWFDISRLLMPWLLVSPRHQHPGRCRIGKFLSYMRKDFNYLCHVSVEEWYTKHACQRQYFKAGRLSILLPVTEVIHLVFCMT